MQERPKKRLLHVWVATWNSWSRQSSCLVMCRDRNSWVATEIPGSRHGSQILSNRTYRNIAFFVAIGVLILCCCDVVIEVFLSRSRRSRQEVRCHDRVWPWARNFMPRQSILCRDRVLSRPRVVLVTQGIFMSLCRDRIFLCCDRILVKARRFLIVTVYF